MIRFIRKIGWYIEDIAKKLCSHKEQYTFNNSGTMVQVCPTCGAVGREIGKKS